MKLGGIAGVTAMLAGGAATYRSASGRTDPPDAERAAADAALDGARASEAHRWAPRVMESAQATHRAAAVELGRQEGRWPLARDFREARRHLVDAAWSLDLAARSAREARRRAGKAADDAIGSARRVMQAADAFARSMPLGREAGVRLRRARLLLAEAETLQGEEEFLLAEEHARDAEREVQALLPHARAQAARYVDHQKVKAWRRWAQETISWSRTHKAAAIVVVKESHRLELYRAGRLVETFRVELGWNTAQDKRMAGDAATPEGRYRVVDRKEGTRTRFHKALLLDYPNAEDRRAFEQARRAGRLPPEATPGNWIEIHGDGGRGSDWTDGCVALANPEMDRLYAAARVGTPVTIVGSLGDGGVFSDLVRRLEASDEATGTP